MRKRRRATQEFSSWLKRVFLSEVYEQNATRALGSINFGARTPFEHYLEVGASANISPSLFFDPEHYEGQLTIPTSTSLLEHFHEHGAAAGLTPHPLVMPRYMTTLGSIDCEIESLPFLNTLDGRSARSHPLFWGDYYLAANPAIMATGVHALAHYLSHPFDQKQRFPREPNPFFVSPVAAEVTAWSTEVGRTLLEHFIATSGSADVSPTPLFDSAHYRQASGLGNTADAPVNAYRHFMQSGLWDDISPHPLLSPSFIRGRFGDSIPEGMPAVLFYLRDEYLQTLMPGPRFDSGSQPDISKKKARNGPWKGRLLERYLLGEKARPRSNVPLLLPDEIRAEVLEVGMLNASFSTPFLDLGGERFTQNFNIFFDSKSRFLEMLEAEIPNGTKVAVALPAMRHGGAERIAANIAGVIEKAGLPTVLLVTDIPVTENPGWFPAGQKIVDVASMVAQLKIEDQGAVRVVSEFLADSDVGLVINVNSKLMWDVYCSFGQTLSALMSLWANLFCFDYDGRGYPVGYAGHIPETIESLDTVLVDNQTFAELVIDRFGLTVDQSKRVSVSRTPVNLPDTPGVAVGGAFDRPRALWTGRLSPQKNPQMVYEVAALVPEIDIVMFGTGSRRAFADRPNIIDGGVYDSFESIQPSGYDLFLHTARWEGLPVVLVEAAGAGLPVVSPLVGGIGELLDESTGFPLEATATASEYAAEIRSVLADAEMAGQRAAALRRRASEMHSWSNFESVVTRELNAIQSRRVDRHGASPFVRHPLKSKRSPNR